MFEEDDKLKDLKFWYKQMEEGTTVEYRCPACRDCAKCKNSDFTDKVSIREEVEQQAIEDSITFDRENKKIWVSLPKRGEERFFLSSNRDIALKVYKKICEKATKDPTIKVEINAAVEKLFRTGQALYLSEVDSERLEKFIHKEVQHYLPWRVVFKADSLTTSCRQVFDASTNTRRRSDGSGGRSLNDLLCKGRIKSMNLLRMMIRFAIGKFSVTGDLQQFYCSCKLLAEEMNLTRFLYNDDLHPDSEPQECLFQALGFGFKSASGQSETVKDFLADDVRDEEPELAMLLDFSTYVDDMGESKATKEEVMKLIDAADHHFEQIGLKCKQWTLSGDKPSEVVSEDGSRVLVGGSEWFPEVDSISTRIPPLHFGKSRRGRLDKDTKFFKSTGDHQADLKLIGEFCPKLTRRICASKAASVFDIRGLLAPVLSGTKCLMRDTVKSTEGWDDVIPSALRDRWLLEFLRLENLRGIAFDRPIMPMNAINSDIRLIGLSDASKSNVMLGVWGGFELPDGTFSCKLIIGRSMLAKDTTIPKLELDGACSGANLGWVVRTALKGWTVSYIQGSDSTIALCWITSEQLRLNEFHRNRVVQVRRGVELESIYHVKTELLVADVGTRPDRVKVEDVMPGSRWHNGDDWMKLTVGQAIAQGCIKPALELRMNEEEKDDFKDGIIFEKVPEVLTRGHALNQDRISKIEQRAVFSQYIVIPTKYSFKLSFRVTMLVIKFIVRCRRCRPFTGTKLSSPVEKVPAIFTTVSSQQDMLDLDMMKLEEMSTILAATYLFRTTTEEVKQFNKKENIEKISVECNNILYSKNRLLESMEFKTVTGMEMVNLDPLGVNTKCPLMDRYSPTAYAFAQYIHFVVSGHSGLETCNRLALERIHIIQGIALFREISAECIKCKIKRRRFLEMSMGPVGEHHLNIAPPFYACQADLFGPVTVYAPGASRDLRGRPAKSCKVWSLVFACPVTRLVNCQVIELSDHSGVLDGITRLAAEVGYPKYLMVDQDGPVMKGLRDAKVNMRDLQHRLYTEHGILFTTCPVGGHNVHGHVERVIKSVQELLEEGGVKNKRLHATGYQTLLKLVENDYNSLPIGYSYDRSLSNTPLLKVITPNFFKLGRNNDRAMEGPIELPHNGAELIEKVSETYRGLFKLWSDVYIPKLIYQPKWHKDDKDLNEGDLVYMKKEPDNVLGSKWIIGIVEQVIPSRDGKVRRVIVKYQNYNEEVPRFTDRSVRKLVKIFDIEEYVMQDDLTELLRRLDADKTAAEVPDVGADPAIQVASSNLNADYFSFIDPNFVSGTWLLPPVPSSCHGQQVGSGEDLNDQEVLAGHDEAVAGDWHQVPADRPDGHSTRSDPVLNPYFYPSLMQAVVKTNPMMLDNTIPSSIVDHFVLAADFNLASPYTQCQDPFENEGIMQMLQGTNMTME